MTLALVWPRFSSPFHKVNCPDGPRYIYKKPKDAFSAVTPDWNARIGAIVEAFNQVKVNFEADIKKRAESIQKLDRDYHNVQRDYIAAYLQYTTNPCDKISSESLAKANEQIRNMEFTLRAIEVLTDSFMRPPKKTRKGFLLRTIILNTDTLSAIERLVSEFHDLAETLKNG